MRAVCVGSFILVSRKPEWLNHHCQNLIGSLRDRGMNDAPQGMRSGIKE
jgi:hypothetical protein